MLSRTFLRPALAVAVGSALALGLTAAPAAAAPTVSAVVVAKVTSTRVTTQPKAASVVVGKTATFVVKAKGTKKTYQWYVRKPGKSTYVAVKGAKSATYKVKTSTKLDGARYRVVVKGSKGKVTSKSALLTVISRPKVTSQPTHQIVTSGKTAAFTVKATGNALRYQWQVRRSGSSTWANLSGKTSSTLKVTARTKNLGDEFRVVVSNKAGTRTSSAATLWVDSTRSDPFAVEAPVLLNDWGVVFGATDFDATAAVLAENQFNDVPPAGWTYVLAPVFVCYLGDTGSGTAWADLDIQLIGSDGRAYDDGYNVIPEDLIDLGDLYAPNGCGTFNAAALLPVSVTSGAVWVVHDSSSYPTSTQYVATR